MEGAATTITTIVNSIGEIVKGGIVWVGDFAGVVVENPLILIGVLLPFVGLGIGLLHRLLRR